jgi:hypothetical protein
MFWTHKKKSNWRKKHYLRTERDGTRVYDEPEPWVKVVRDTRRTSEPAQKRVKTAE